MAQQQINLTPEELAALDVIIAAARKDPESFDLAGFIGAIGGAIAKAVGVVAAATPAVAQVAQVAAQVTAVAGGGTGGAESAYTEGAGKRSLEELLDLRRKAGGR